MGRWIRRGAGTAGGFTTGPLVAYGRLLRWADAVTRLPGSYLRNCPLFAGPC
jgi:hypothetical protein